MGIIYELAKELKEAGFPQKTKKYSHVLMEDRGERIVSEDGSLPYRSDTYTILPTLSELIEECGNDFGALMRNNNREWDCYKFNLPLQGAVSGLTPEEAVAKLWLTLNKK